MKFDRETHEFFPYTHNPENLKSLSHNRITAIHEDKSGTLWIGTQSGLNSYDFEKNEFIHWKNEPGNSNSLSNNEILAIYEDTSNVLWIGTHGGGLNKFDREKEIFTSYGEKDGLPNDVIYGILEDDRGDLWLSTNKGLSRFNPRTEMFKNYDINDGLQIHVSNNEYGIRTTDSRLAAEIGYGTALSGMTRKDANGIVNTLLEKYEKDIPEAPIGKTIQEMYDMERAVPGDEAREQYEETVKELKNMGVPFPY